MWLSSIIMCKDIITFLTAENFNFNSFSYNSLMNLLFSISNNILIKCHSSRLKNYEIQNIRILSQAYIYVQHYIIYHLLYYNNK